MIPVPFLQTLHGTNVHVSGFSFCLPSPPGLKNTEIKSMTAFTVQTADGNIQPRIDRPALVVSSTSWTGEYEIQWNQIIFVWNLGF